MPKHTEFYNFTMSEFKTFLKEKGFNRRCPVCAGTDYGIVPDLDESTYFYMAAGSGNNQNKKLAYAVVCVVCANCGYAIQFAAEIVQKWLDRRLLEEVKERN